MEGHHIISRKNVLTLRKFKRDGRKTALKDLLHNFAENTSLLGVTQTYRKRSFFWFIAAVLTLSMSIFQSWNATTEFFENKTSQRITLRSLRLLPFPSITICNHIVLPQHFNHSLIEGYDTDAIRWKKHKCKTREDEKFLTRLVQKNRRMVIQYLRQLPAEKQANLSQQYDDYVEDCDYSEHGCEMMNITHYFHNPFYGNCFTFNAAYMPYEPLLIDMHGQFVLRVNIGKGYRLSGKKATAGVLIHPPGTAPVLDSPGVLNLRADKALGISLRIAEKAYVKKIIASKPTCVSHDDDDYRKKSLYYTADTPYEYSLDACMKTCEQNLIAKTCGIINPALPLQSPEYEARLNTSLPPISLTCDLKENFDTETCDCPLPCNITNYVMTVDTTEYLSVSCTNESEADDEPQDQTKSSIIVYFSSNTAERVEEFYVYGWAEFLGSLGGNLSLWTGICILSVLEIAELVVQMMGICLKRQPSATSDFQSTSYQPRSTAIHFSHRLN